MSKTLLSKFIGTCFFIFSWNAFAINKCTDASGKVTFQDTACPKIETTIKPSHQSVKKVDSSVKIITLDIADGTQLSMPLPSDWTLDTSPSDKNTLSNLKATNTTNEVTLMISAFPLKENISNERKKTMISSMSEDVKARYLSYGNTKVLDTRQVNTSSSNGTGILYTFADEQLLTLDPLPPSESPYAVAGIMIIDHIMITATILSNSIKTQDYASALTAIHFISNDKKTPN